MTEDDVHVTAVANIPACPACILAAPAMPDVYAFLAGYRLAELPLQQGLIMPPDIFGGIMSYPCWPSKDKVHSTA